MVRVFTLVALCTLMLQVPASAQQPTPPPATPADYVLATLILRHDQSRNLEEITKILDKFGILGQISAGRDHCGIVVRCDGPRSRCYAQSTARTIARGEQVGRAECLEGLPHRGLHDLRLS